jgi:mannose-6-phosphate isomerase-like protein (cupin superfamily)
MSTSVAPFAAQSSEGSRLVTPTGDRAIIMANSRKTNGSLAVIELTNQPKNGPPLHSHVREDEVWYVLEGEYRFKAGDTMFRVSEGGMAFGPRGVPHSFQNVGDAPARLLVITTPAGTEQYFEDFAKLPPGPIDPEALATLALASGVELLGPPLSVSDPL